MMKLTFLGTGTSSGVPQLRCHCPICSSSDKADHRLRASALVEVGGKNLLIDCGPDFRAQMLKMGSPDLSGVLLTHSHYDHIGGIDDLRPYSSDYKEGFPVYCTEDVADDIKRLMPYAFAQNSNSGVPHFDIHTFCLEHPQPFTPLPGVEIIPIPIHHSPNGPLIAGFRIGPLSYITDCKSLTPQAREIIEGTHTLVINSLRHTPHPTHMNLKQALDVIKDVRPRQALLTHVSHGIGLHAETSRLLPKGVTLARDFLSINIPD